jgi:hypothetical protein
MSTAVLTSRLDLSSVADSSLKAATRFWFVVTVIGQFVFAFAVASFYGLTAARGDMHKWGKSITHGYVPGDTMGNTAVIMHLASAVVLMLSGTIQFVPAVRSHFPAFHRWNGRIYMLTTVTLSTAGLYMHWVRGSVGTLTQHILGSLNAPLMWLCAAFALRYAMARDFRTHRRWALRLFMVASASWFFRIAFFLWIAVFRGPFGFDPSTLAGPFPTFMMVGQYLIPLAILELYFMAQDRGTSLQRIGAAAMVTLSTLIMVGGLFAVTMAIWVPDVKAGFDSRKSIAETVSATINSGGIDQAIAQYHTLKSANTTNYNFDEDELNSLGYQLIHQNKLAEAIRVFRLNVESYPQSSNAWDSLAEGYMDAGNKAEAIANYKKAIQLKPDNHNSIAMLRKLTSQ